MATTTSSPPTLSTPASARLHPGTATKAGVPATVNPLRTAPATKAGAPATVSPLTSTTATKTAPATSGTPTTTYVPSGANALPGTSSTTAGTSATLSKTTVNARTLTHARSKHSETLSPGAIAIAVVAALLVLACLAWALARRRAFEPHWLLSLRHAMAEAGFRASATWAEFADWARLGR
ncbi:MAG TPA: hypothetical protein VII53_10800 [Solirubrobacteraceae bacterium]